MNLPHDTDAIAALMSAAQVHLHEKRVDAAVECFERVVESQPANAAALQSLAEIMLDRSQYVVARKYAVRSVKAAPDIPNILLLANIDKTIGNLEGAFSCYQTVLNNAPQNIAALMGLADVYEKAGDRAQAMNYCEKVLALTPQNMALLNKVAKLCPHPDCGRVVPLYERARPPENAPTWIKLKFQLLFLTRKEAAERAQRKLSPHAQSADDLFVRFAQDDLDALERMADIDLAGETPAPDAYISKGACLLARGEILAAEPFLRAEAAQREDPKYATMMLNGSFYRQLQDTDSATLQRELPPLVDLVKQSFTAGPVVFLSCDVKYFEWFARPLLASMNDVAPGLQVHMHIMNLTAEDARAACDFCARLTNIKIAVSAEDVTRVTTNTMTSRLYFHAIRFARMLHYAMAYQRPLWLMDVDGLMNRDPRTVLDSPDNGDVTLSAHAGRLEPWCQFNASCVGIQPTTAGLAYLQLVAAFIVHFYKKGALWWGIDQFALYGVFQYLTSTADGPKVTMLPDHMLDGEYTPEGIVWGNGTAAKFDHIISMPKALKNPPDSPRLRYAAALKKYAPADS